MAKVNIEVATADIQRWLDAKRISERKRTNQNESIISLIDAVCDGDLKVNENCELVQSLIHPIGDEKMISELTYKSRIQIGQIHEYLKNVKPGDADGRIVAYISALTGNTPAVIKKMDTEDYSIAQSIAVFFL